MMVEQALHCIDTAGHYEWILTEIGMQLKLTYKLSE